MLVRRGLVLAMRAAPMVVCAVVFLAIAQLWHKVAALELQIRALSQAVRLAEFERLHAAGFDKLREVRETAQRYAEKASK